MRIIHIADLHLGSKIESKLKRISDSRKALVRESFNRVVDYAKDNNINVILLSGDIFDSDKPLKKDKEFFYSVIRNNKDIDFLYLKGNHDTLESYNEDLDNLKLFSNEWISYRYDDVVISGIELNDSNYKSFYSTLNLSSNNKNIVMLHGSIGNTATNNTIKLSLLKDKYINYLALGHIHSFNTGELDNNSCYAYPGCLVGRGFDELGPKGFIVYDTDTYNITFKELNNINILETNINISEASDLYQALSIIKNNMPTDKNQIYRVNINGDVSSNLDISTFDVSEALKDYYFIDVKFNINFKINIDDYKNDVSLKGEAIRLIEAMDDIDDITKDKLINIILKSLLGKENII